jgi:dihydrofolate synthase/folylpolyglutamate synthase
VAGATGEALDVIRRRARRVGAPLTEVSPAPLLGWDRDAITVDLPALGPTRISLRGRHQAENAAVADALLDALETAGIATVPAEARRRGYGSATWPGRLELLRVDGRDVLLDGAHNPAGAAALATALDDLRPFLAGAGAAREPSGGGTFPAPVTLVHGSMGDKDVAGIVAALARATALRGATVIATQVPGERPLPAEDVAAHWRATDQPPGGTVEVVPGVGPALDRALDVAGRAGGPVVVAGSLYLVGEARRRWVDDPMLRDPEEPRG